MPEIYGEEPPRATLVDWLRRVKEAEHRIYVIDETIDAGARTIRELEEPIRVEEETPVVLEPELENDSGGSIAAGVFTAAYIIGYVAWVVLSFKYQGVLWGIGGLFLGFIWPLIALGALTIEFDNWDVFCYVMIGILVIGFLAGVISEGVSSQRIENRNKAEKAKVNKQNHDAANAAKENNRKRREDAALRTELQLARVPVVQRELAELRAEQGALMAKRDELYERGYLHPSYRGLAAVTTILHLLETGRCDRLYGHGGAIDTLVHDSQFELIVGRLDAIVSRLDMLGTSMRYLSDEMRGCRREIEAMGRGIGSLKDELDRIDLSSVTDEVQELLRSSRGQEGSLLRIRECEEYRAQCEAYRNGHRQYSPSRLS